MQFAVFFLLIAFVVTCNFLLFFRQIRFTVEEVQGAAWITFGNVLVLTLLFCILDAIRRNRTITRPVKRIQEGIDRVMTGDFSTRISYIYGEESGNEFDVIIKGLNTMIEELSGVETLRTDFIANVSHELKTPLAVLQNYETFEFTYSAKQQAEIEKIRRKYVTTEEDKMALLRNLDKNVTRPGTIVSIVIGLIGCLLLGIGMCCTMVWSGQYVFIFKKPTFNKT